MFFILSRVAKVVEFQEKLHNCYKKITVSSCAVDSRLKAFLDLLATPFLGWLNERWGDDCFSLQPEPGFLLSELKANAKSKASSIWSPPKSGFLFLIRAPLISSSVSPLGFLKSFFCLRKNFCVLAEMEGDALLS